MKGWIDRLEQRLEEIEMVDVLGDPLLPAEKRWRVGMRIGPVWDQVEQDFRDNRINLEMYQTAVMALIDEYERSVFREKLEQKLAELRRAV